MGENEVKLSRFKVGGTFETFFEQIVEATDEEAALRKVLKEGPDARVSNILHPITVEFIHRED